MSCRGRLAGQLLVRGRCVVADFTSRGRDGAFAVLLVCGPERRDRASRSVLDLLHLEAALQRVAPAPISRNVQSRLIRCLEWKSCRARVLPNAQDLVVWRGEVEGPPVGVRRRTERRSHATNNI